MTKVGKLGSLSRYTHRGAIRVYEMAVADRVDARGKRCPMPVLMAKRAIAECCPGDAIEILVTDPSAPKDFETFARLEGHSVSCETRDEVTTIRLRLSEAK